MRVCLENDYVVGLLVSNKPVNLSSPTPITFFVNIYKYILNIVSLKISTLNVTLDTLHGHGQITLPRSRSNTQHNGRGTISKSVQK